MEEESLPWYKPDSFYPVQIGEAFHSRYQVLYKLGYVATTSTIWICRDLDHDRYICMKSMIHYYPSVNREIAAYEILSGKCASKPTLGMKYVRQALDRFQLRHGDYNYHFLVHEPLGLNMELLLDQNGQGFYLSVVRDLAGMMLRALQFLHSSEIVHAGRVIKLQDVRYTEEEEITNPSPRKITANSAIFAKKEFSGPVIRWMGPKSYPFLCDFGEARTGKKYYQEYIQPASDRTPEVLLRLPWSTPADIWNLGCMMWHFASGQFLFPRENQRSLENKQSADGVHLATVAMLLGPPPQALPAKSGPRALKFFNKDGSAKTEVPDETLELRLASTLEGTEDPMTPEEAKAFVAFFRRVLIWEEDRQPTALKILQDEWINPTK